MTPLAQLWHVFMKDIRQQRWLLLLYLVLVVVAAGHAVGWRPFTDGVFGGTMMVVGLVILLLVASVIQGDSPTRTDAFWASHPLDPYAVLGAKALLAIALLAVGAIGQEVVLQTYDATSADVARLVVEPVRVLGEVMLIAGLVASLTRDLRTFTMVLIVTPLVMILSIVLITAMLRDGVAFRIGGQGTQLARIVALVLAAALIPWLYRTRDNRWKVRIAGYVIAGVAIMTIFMGSAVRQVGPRAAAPGRRPVPHFPLSVEAPPGGVHQDPDQITLSVVTPAIPEPYRAVVRGPVATLRFGDGSSATVSLGYGFRFFVIDSKSVMRPAIPGVRWLADGRPATTTTSTISGVLTPEQRQSLDASGATVVVEAAVEVDTIEAGDAIPLVVGTTVRKDGRRTTIERWNHYAASPEILIRTATLADETPFELGEEWEYALLNRKRGEALPLKSVERNQGIEGLVLPATTLSSSKARVTAMKRGPLDGPPPLDDWYRDAELLPVVTRSLGTYPVKFTLTIPPR